MRENALCLCTARFLSQNAQKRTVPLGARCAFRIYFIPPGARRKTVFASPQLLPRTAVRRLRGVTLSSQRRPPKK